MMEASIAVGVKQRNLVKTSSETITVIAITMFDTTVSQPALKFTAVLENDPIRKSTWEVEDKQMNQYA